MNTFLLRKRLSIVFFFVFPFFLFSQTNFSTFQLFREKKYDEAIVTARHEIDANSATMDDYVFLVRSLIALGRYQEANYWARQGQNADTFDHRLIESMGEIHYFLGDNIDALGFFQQYVSMSLLGEDRANSYFFMGDIYIRLQMYNHADIALSLATLYEPFNETWWTKLGYAREMCRSYTRAYEAYEKTLQINPQNSEARSGKNRMENRIK